MAKLAQELLLHFQTTFLGEATFGGLRTFPAGFDGLALGRLDLAILGGVMM
ncbi:hypothetical protein [Ectopseudomonas oleovorans]|uniref:Uncharacterized protein n=2 Tax=Ectopseudomonas oleovorans TaxID=301 RepID=A0AA42U043_ECTOL|nr:hypothetical protein [Pseudomonas oleovorans]MDH1340605.1 hypothetical protein [Pseudomonas oleovorans]MDH1491577.1 hypothetical protein [Pseudomonas oleovorans]WGG22452.1 hypothetical protein N5O83_07205 [Pseudomonas oleovorans]CDM41434.1 hypothetical protein BN5_2874 [Pseudomonas oleovorans CECT 5344]CDR92062.1 hypothetical protein PPSAL_2835 [Pseudomonas oleovorans]